MTSLVIEWPKDRMALRVVCCEHVAGLATDLPRFFPDRDFASATWSVIEHDGPIGTALDRRDGI